MKLVNAQNIFNPMSIDKISINVTIFHIKNNIIKIITKGPANSTAAADCIATAEQDYIM
jgi:hypothetical protein